MNSRCTDNADNAAEPLGKFRQQLYESFPKRRDAAMNLLIVYAPTPWPVPWSS